MDSSCRIIAWEPPGTWVDQDGGKHPDAKPLKGFGGAGVLEIVEGHDGDTYRAVYTVRFAEAVYVLHVFQKKSKKKIATPKHELELIRARLKEAERRHEEYLRKESNHERRDRVRKGQRKRLRRPGAAQTRRRCCSKRTWRIRSV
jgi:phage-related protein